MELRVKVEDGEVTLVNTEDLLACARKNFQTMIQDKEEVVFHLSHYLKAIDDFPLTNDELEVISVSLELVLALLVSKIQTGEVDSSLIKEEK